MIAADRMNTDREHREKYRIPTGKSDWYKNILPAQDSENLEEQMTFTQVFKLENVHILIHHLYSSNAGEALTD